MNTQQKIRERFLKDIVDHEMTVIRDDINGINRHIRFRKPGTGIYGFDLVTWPGVLCYTGDMGTFVFSRIEDMFQFFRGKLFSISTGYWAEKVIASGRDGIRQYSPDMFISAVEEYFKDLREDLPQDETEALHERLKDEVLSMAYDGEYPAMLAAMDFEHEGELVLQDFWEANVEEFTPTFLWCCHAIQWGISVYDKKGE